MHFAYVNYFRVTTGIGDIAVKISLANIELRSATPFMLIGWCYMLNEGPLFLPKHLQRTLME